MVKTLAAAADLPNEKIKYNELPFRLPLSSTQMLKTIKQLQPTRIEIKGIVKNITTR